MIFYKIIVKKYLTFMYERYIMIKSLAGVAELADALDLGSSVNDVGVQVLFPAPYRQSALTSLVQ